MRIIVFPLLLLMCFSVHGQDVDSVSAILIRYEVKRDMKESLRNLEADPRIEQYYIIIKDSVIITREVAKGGVPTLYYALWDMTEGRKYRCLLDSTGVYAALTTDFYPDVVSVKERYPDSTITIKGMECKSAEIVTNDDRLDIWYTETFGIGFSPVGKIRGVPLYFEMRDEIDGRLRYKAVELEPVKIPEHWVDISSYGLFNSSSPPSRKPVYTPETFTQFARKDLNGTLFSTASVDGQLLFISFMPERSIANEPDLGTLNAVISRFENAPIKFVATWKGSPKKVQEYLNGVELNSTIIPKCGQLFSQNGITHRPTHFLIDKRGNIRYKYEGHFGAPLYNALVADIEELIR